MISDGESLSPARVGIDVPALAGYLDKAVGGLAGPLSVALISGGRSNLTSPATDGHQHWVVRRPPLGHVLATAHDMTREAVVMSALAGTDVPVPEVVACCPDDGVIGAPFYVMRQVEGIVLRTDDDLDDLDRLDPTPARALGFDLIDVLARLPGRSLRRGAGGLRAAGRLPRTAGAAMGKAAGRVPLARDCRPGRVG